MDSDDAKEDSCICTQTINTLTSITKPTNTNGVDSEDPFTRDPDFWLEDGNIILLAGNTAFRVYRGLLKKHSVVFADMFATATVDAGETFEDCPVVRLSDHPEDLKDLLTCIMPCSTVRSVSPSILSFLQVITDTSPSPHRSRINAKTGAPSYHFAELYAAIHLAHKYQCADVKLRALPLLKQSYPSVFSDYDAHDTSKAALDDPPPSAAVAVVNIARLTGTLSMLPLALYRACTLEERILDGYTWRDGSVEHLAPEDLRLCMRARKVLAREHAALVKRAFAPAEGEGRCQDTSEHGMCKSGRDDICGDVEYYARGDCAVLYSYGPRVERLAEAFGVCDACRDARLEREREGRRKAWMLLPGMFGLTVEECGFGTGVDVEDGEEPQEP